MRGRVPALRISARTENGVSYIYCAGRLRTIPDPDGTALPALLRWFASKGWKR